MSLLDTLNFRDAEYDIAPEDVAHESPVSPAHLMDLHERGLLHVNDVLPVRGWYHVLRYDATYKCFHAEMWAGPSGEHYTWEGDPNDMCWE